MILKINKNGQSIIDKDVTSDELDRIMEDYRQSEIKSVFASFNPRTKLNEFDINDNTHEIIFELN